MSKWKNFLSFAWLAGAGPAPQPQASSNAAQPIKFPTPVSGQPISRAAIKAAFADYDAGAFERGRILAVALIDRAETPDQLVEALENSLSVARQLQTIQNLGSDQAPQPVPQN